jgi:hypothetical protein
MEFLPYKAKPVTRMAIQIQAWHVVTAVVGAESTYVLIDEASDESDAIVFKAYQVPVTGDWVVRRTEEDTYHCADAVFRERNVVPE